MKVEREDFESGWSDISVKLSRNEVDRAIELLRELKEGNIGHFHMASRHDDDSRISDIEFSIAGEEEKHNMDLLGRPIAPDK
jgi:hypothetical protein